MNLQDIPQSLIDTTTDILEARRNPELNPKIGPYTQLKKYTDDPSIFISFTEIDKIGINPQSNYNTPIGIYTYPLQASWEKYKVEKIFDRSAGSTEEPTVQTERNVIFRAFPFASENPYIQVVQAKKPLTDLQDFTKGDLQNAVYQISKIIKESNADSVIKTRAAETFKDDLVKKIREGRANPLVNTPGGLFWWLTKECVEIDVVGKLLGKNYKSKIPMRVWNYLLRDLGHDGFIDKGDGIIHRGEPTQAVFLHRKAFKKIDMIYNNPSIKSKKKEKLYFWMNDNEIGDDARYKYKERDDSYDWEGGTFISGVWKRGYWEDGLWLDGVWERGLWYDGIWKDGRFILGDFRGGTWKDGTFGNPSTYGNVFLGDAVWEDGTWMNGSFRAKEWQDGIWNDGNFENSTWRNGTWKDGTFTGSFWRNGTWEEGRFERSTWEDGKWLFGKFIDSKWLNGLWENGIFRGTWEDGIWKYGFFGVAPKNTQFALRNTIWNNGVWENGLFVKGEFNGGIWKDGFWFLGEWNGGQWQGGRIYSKRFGPNFTKGNSTDAFLDAIINISELVAFSKKIEGLGDNRGFVESRVNPKEFYQIEDEVDSIEELEERVAP